MVTVVSRTDGVVLVRMILYQAAYLNRSNPSSSCSWQIFQLPVSRP